MASVDEFAQAVAKLERQLLRLPGEREVAEELRWSLSREALIGLGQEAKTAGLVRIFLRRGDRASSVPAL